ncbi:MAG: alpha/beta hydrolase [Chloroflexi bacterium]|nr:alpha/beta hydrolase [Chloroflexota bacterium]
MKKSPRQRFQEFQSTLPQFSKRKRRLIIAGGMSLLLGFVVFVLPFLLPFGGPKTQPSEKLADPEGAFSTIDGSIIYYEHFPADGETILLIHGQAGSTETWREAAPALQAAGYDVYAIDLIGLGLSEKGLEPDFSYRAQAAMVSEFMDQQRITGVTLVAHAFGSNIAVMLAQQQPDRVKALALVAPTLFTEPTPEIPEWVLNLPFLQRWARVGMRFVVHEAVGEQLRSATKIDEVVDNGLIAAYGRVLHTEDWDLAVIGMLRDSHRNSITGPLESVQMPVLLLWGTEDGWATPDNAKWMLDAFPDSCLVEFEDVGHLPMHERSSEFSEMLIKFFQSSCTVFMLDVSGNE